MSHLQELPCRVLQDRFGEKGNCTEACIASVLDVGLADVPSFGHRSDWWERMSSYLMRCGLMPLHIPIDHEGLDETGMVPEGLHLASVQSPRMDRLHSVVVLDGKIVHDPHPAQDAYDLPVLSYVILVPLTEAAP